VPVQHAGTHFNTEMAGSGAQNRGDERGSCRKERTNSAAVPFSHCYNADANSNNLGLAASLADRSAYTASLPATSYRCA